MNLEDWSRSCCHLCQCSAAKSLNVRHSLRNYFAFLHYIFMWLMIVSVIGVVFTATSFYTMDAAVNPAIDACNKHSSEFYMCPTCNGDCDFWYFKIKLSNGCVRQFRLVIDNPVMWVYCIVVIASALALSCIMMVSYSPMDTGNISNSSSDCSFCCFTLQLLLTVVAIVLFTGLFFGYFILTLLLERLLRLYLHDRNISNMFFITISVIFLDVVLALVQAMLNKIARWIYELAIDRILDDSNHTCRFLLFWTYNSFISYLPILYRIYFYGQIVGDPMKGYSNIGVLRLQHCPSFGCIEVVIYVVVNLIAIFCSSLGCCCISCCQPNNGKASNIICGRDSYPKQKINHYVELNIVYGFTVFFITAAGFLPLLVGVITVAMIARYRACYYTKEKGDNSDENAPIIQKVWLWSFLGMTLFAMFTNIAIVIPNSRLVQHIAYSTRDSYHPTLNFDGYLDRVLPQHNLTRLIEIRGFPNFNAHYLTATDSKENTVKNPLGEDILYMPFVNFDCLNQGGFYSGRNFTRRSYIDFTKANSEDNPIVQYRNKQAIAPGRCFNFSSQCRSRGFLDNTKESRHLHVVRSAFVVLFIVPVITTVIFVVGACFILSRSEN